MIKKFISILLLACSAFTMSAESKYMTVELQNSVKISFLLDDNPIITYENESLLINKDSETTYSIDDVKNYHFTENNQTAAETISANTLRIVKLDEQTFKVENAQPNSIVTINAINGVVVSKVNADTEGNAIIKMSNQTGVYVITAGNQAFKIIKK